MADRSDNKEIVKKLEQIRLELDGGINATLTTGDIQIGAVELKDAESATRATVGANGLHVDVRNIQAGSNIIGKVGIDQTTLGTTNGVSLVAHALSTGAPTAFRSLTQSNGTGVDVKAGAGNLYGWNIINLHTATCYLKFYNVAAPTSANTPVLTLMVPANSTIYQEPICIQHNFSTRIAIRYVTGSADADDTAAATLPIVELKYS